MTRTTFTLALAAFALSVAALGARADCASPAEVWELELESVEVLEGPGSAEQERLQLGTGAVLRGTFMDAERPDLARVWLESSTQDWLWSFEEAP